MYKKPTFIQSFDELMSQLIPAFRDDIQQATDAHLSDSSLVETQQGIIEYALAHRDLADKGSVLMSHTAVGGYDQSLATGRRFKGYQIIAPSRAGYLRTPAETGITPEKMADAYAGLLDSLEIEQVVMVGLSAGGMSAVQFALRYPNRCVGLILGAAITAKLPAFTLDILAPLSLSNQSDFANWVTNRIGQSTASIRTSDKETQIILRALLDTSPTSARWAGYHLDMKHARHFHPSLASILCPTLLIHGTSDWIVPYKLSQAALDIIPNADLLSIKGGQHDSPIVAGEQIIAPINAFLKRIFASIDGAEEQ